MLYIKRPEMFSRLLRAEEGVTAVEFALIAPAFLFLTMGIMEFSMVMYASSVLEGAVADSSRLGKTGYIEENMTREQLIRQRLDALADGLLNTNYIQIATRVYQDFNQIGEPEPFTDLNGNGELDEGEKFSDVNGNGTWDADMAEAGLGEAGDVVVYDVTYPWPIFTPFLASMIGNQDGTFTISSSIVVRNEPYNVMLVGG